MQEGLVFLTGGSGFIGSELIRKLTARGFKVRALMRKTSPLRNLEGCDFEPCYGDLQDVQSLKKGVAGVDYIFHLAGVVTARTSSDFYKHNSDGTKNLALAAREVNPTLKRFVHVSSIAASGPAKSRTPKLEGDLCEPVSHYGKSKLSGEKELEQIAKGSFPISIVRPSLVYGPRDIGVLEFFKFVKMGIFPQFTSQDPDKEKYYCMIHVEDLVDGILAAGLSTGQSEKEVYFFTDGNVYSWTQIINEIAKAMQKKTIKVPFPISIVRALAKTYELAGKLTGKNFPLNSDKVSELLPDYWVYSSENAVKKLKYAPKYSLSDGFKHTVGWYKQNKWL